MKKRSLILYRVVPDYPVILNTVTISKYNSVMLHKCLFLHVSFVLEREQRESY